MSDDVFSRLDSTEESLGQHAEVNRWAAFRTQELMSLHWKLSMGDEDRTFAPKLKAEIVDEMHRRGLAYDGIWAEETT